MAARAYLPRGFCSDWRARDTFLNRNGHNLASQIFFLMSRNPRGGWLLYVMIHLPLVFFFKVGITSLSIGAKARAKGIDRQMWGLPIPIFILPIPGAYHVEQALHKMLRRTNVKFYRGSGHQEWFFLSPLIVVVPIMLVVWGFYIGIADMLMGTQMLPFVSGLIFRFFFWAYGLF